MVHVICGAKFCDRNNAISCKYIIMCRSRNEKRFSFIWFEKKKDEHIHLFRFIIKKWKLFEWIDGMVWVVFHLIGKSDAIEIEGYLNSPKWCTIRLVDAYQRTNGSRLLENMCFERNGRENANDRGCIACNNLMHVI